MPAKATKSRVSLEAVRAYTTTAALRVREQHRYRDRLSQQVDKHELERMSLRAFIPAIMRTDEGLPAVPPRHIDEIVIPALEDDSLGDTVVVAPPGAAKTNTLIAYCLHRLGTDPSAHAAYISNTAQQAYRRSVAIKDTIERDPRFHAIFPEVLADKAKGWSEAEWFLKREDISDKDATMTALGVGGPLLGARLKFGVLDDIADLENMATQLQREKLRLWLKTTFETRFVPGARKFHLTTRWHAADAAAYCIEQGWHYILIPAIGEDGESYWPERFPRSELKCISEHRDPPRCCTQAKLGSNLFNLMYQGQVVDEEGALFQRKWWQRYRTLPANANRGMGFLDLIQVDKTESDFYALSTWRTDGARYYITGCIQTRGSWTDMKSRIVDWYAREGCPLVVEDVSWANPQIQDLEELSRGQRIDVRTGQTSGRLGPPILRFKPGGVGKIARAQPYSTYVEAGIVMLPESAAWVEDWIEEHAQFPNGAHDDQVDTGSMAIARLELDRPITFAGILPSSAATPLSRSYSLIGR